MGSRKAIAGGELCVFRQLLKTMRIQGIGTDFYGKTKYNPADKSYITTKWFVVFLLPIVPLKSYRVIKGPGYETSRVVVFSNEQLYKILEEISLKKNIAQILLTYSMVYGGLGIFVFSIFLTMANPFFIFAPVIMVIIFLIKLLISK
jgi:hypothetical protein